MLIYWSNKRMPELHGLSRDERQLVILACAWRGFVSPRCLLALLATWLCSMAGMVLSVSLHIVFGAPVWLSLITAFILGGLNMLIFLRVFQAHIRPFYADYVKHKLRKSVDDSDGPVADRD